MRKPFLPPSGRSSTQFLYDIRVNTANSVYIYMFSVYVGVGIKIHMYVYFGVCVCCEHFPFHMPQKTKENQRSDWRGTKQIRLKRDWGTIPHTRIYHSTPRLYGCAVILDRGREIYLCSECRLLCLNTMTSILAECAIEAQAETSGMTILWKTIGEQFKNTKHRIADIF